MARISTAPGLCPICGRNSVRTLSYRLGLVTEAYHCDLHGRRGPATGMTVAEWATAPPMPALGEILGIPVVA